jgi:integrase
MPRIDDVWEGGYIRVDSRGKKTFIIRRSIGGERYEVSTRVGTWRGAMEQLKRFEANPAQYTPGGDAPRDALLMTQDLVQKFLDWSRDEKKNSHTWRWTQAWALKWWGEKLAGLNLRGGVSLAEHITPALAAEPKNKHHRIAVLKAFFAWLRKVRHEIEPKDDPTLQALAVPQSRPEQWKKDKVIPKRDYSAVVKALDPKKQKHWRAALTVQLATGWHVTEVIRFAQGGSIEAHPRKKSSVLLCPQTKGGNMLRTEVSAVAIEAGKVLLAYGSFTWQAYNKAINEAIVTANEDLPEGEKIEAFTPGRFRHTVATAAINAGEDPATVAAFLNHRDSRTTRRFYATHSVPKKVSTLA